MPESEDHTDPRFDWRGALRRAVRVESHAYGPRLHLLGHRVHEWHLGLGLAAIAAATAVAHTGLLTLTVLGAVAGWLIAKDWRDIHPATRDTATWSLGLHRLPDAPAARPLRDRVPVLAAVTTAAVGAVNVGSALTSELPARVRDVLAVAPAGDVRLAHALALPAGLALLASAWPLARRRRRALYLAVGLLGALGVLNMVKGLDVEEAAVSWTLAAGLWRARSAFWVAPHHEGVGKQLVDKLVVGHREAAFGHAVAPTVADGVQLGDRRGVELVDALQLCRVAVASDAPHGLAQALVGPAAEIHRSCREDGLVPQVEPPQTHAPRHGRDRLAGPDGAHGQAAQMRRPVARRRERSAGIRGRHHAHRAHREVERELGDTVVAQQPCRLDDEEVVEAVRGVAVTGAAPAGRAGGVVDRGPAPASAPAPGRHGRAGARRAALPARGQLIQRSSLPVIVGAMIIPVAAQIGYPALGALILGESAGLPFPVRRRSSRPAGWLRRVTWRCPW